MIQHHEKCIAQCSLGSMFSTIIDVESYPEFVPGCNTANIQVREKDLLIVDQQFGVGPVAWDFSSRAIYHKPEEVIICTQDGPFRSLEIHWKLVDTGKSLCSTELLIRADFTTLLLQKMIKPLLSVSGSSIISVFEQRARLYERKEIGQGVVNGQSLARKPV